MVDKFMTNNVRKDRGRITSQYEKYRTLKIAVCSTCFFFHLIKGTSPWNNVLMTACILVELETNNSKSIFGLVDYIF